MCVFVFVFVFLSICHHQMISFQKIYGLYGLKHNTMEINGDVTMETDRQPTWPRKVKIMLVSKYDCINQNTIQYTKYNEEDGRADQTSNVA